MLANEQYHDWYEDLATKGHHIILDNGAAESRVPSNKALTKHIQDFQPTEFALPDILGDSDATVAAGMNFYYDHHNDVPSDVSWGFVAQGTTIDDACGAVNAIMDSAAGSEIEVIYVPRLLVKEAGPRARSEVAEYIHHRYPELTIHMFGMSNESVREPLWIAKTCPYVRSIDTSLPYYYAEASITLSEDTLVKVDRPDNYFDLKFWDRSIANHNINVLSRWVQGNE
jgi:hypothetical protein